MRIAKYIPLVIKYTFITHILGFILYSAGKDNYVKAYHEAEGPQISSSEGIVL